MLSSQEQTKPEERGDLELSGGKIFWFKIPNMHKPTLDKISYEIHLQT